MSLLPKSFKNIFECASKVKRFELIFKAASEAILVSGAALKNKRASEALWSCFNVLRSSFKLASQFWIASEASSKLFWCLVAAQKKASRPAKALRNCFKALRSSFKAASEVLQKCFRSTCEAASKCFRSTFFYWGTLQGISTQKLGDQEFSISI